MVPATVLVADGEPLIRWSIGERLRAEGYDVLEAATGREAVARFTEGADVVVLDLDLPDLDGLSVLTRLRELNPDVRVVLLTANTGIASAAETIKPGFPVAHKPFLLDDVTALVEQALEGGDFPQHREKLRSLRVRMA